MIFVLARRCEDGVWYYSEHVGDQHRETGVLDDATMFHASLLRGEHELKVDPPLPTNDHGWSPLPIEVRLKAAP